MENEEKTREQLVDEIRELTNRLAGLQVVEAERNKADEALIQTQLRLHHLLSSSPGVIYTGRPFGDYGTTFISENVISQLGYKDHEFIQDSRFWIEHVHPEDADRILTQLPRLFEQGYHAHEYRFRHKDGTYRWVRDEMRLIRDSEGNPVEIVGFWLDITERKGMEDALRESEVKFRSQFHLSPQAIAITEMHTGRLLDVNDKLCELSRFTREELIGRTTTEVGFISGEERERIVRELESSGEVRDFQSLIKVKDGTMLTGVLFARLIQIKGNPHVLTVFVDLTERRRLRAQLDEARKMEAIATLAAGIAHEFNNALTGIIGNLDLLELALPGNHQAGNYLKPMKSSAFRMAKLTSQLLAYAREGKYQTRTLSLSDFVEDILPVLRHGIDSEIRLETDLPLHVSPVEADPTQMQMVLSAVVANAAEAIEGRGRIRISTGNEEISEETAQQHPELRTGSYVCLRVDDDGIGMDEETRARMFEPFFTTKFHGRGLGMAAVYGIVRNHNGWIGVDSELGKGTVVRIYLPAAGRSDKVADKDLS